MNIGYSVSQSLAFVLVKWSFLISLGKKLGLLASALFYHHSRAAQTVASRHCHLEKTELKRLAVRIDERRVYLQATGSTIAGTIGRMASWVGWETWHRRYRTFSRNNVHRVREKNRHLERGPIMELKESRIKSNHVCFVWQMMHLFVLSL